MAIPVSTISVRVIPLLSACSALHGLYEAGTHGAAPTFEHHESYTVSMTDSKKTAKYLEKSQKYRTFAGKKQFYEYEKNQNATIGKNHHCHPVGCNLRQFLQ